MAKLINMFVISCIQRDLAGGISTGMGQKVPESTFDEVIKQEKVKLLNNVRMKETKRKFFELLMAHKNSFKTT